MEYYLLLKRKTILEFATWMKLADIILSEKTRYKYCMISLVESIKLNIQKQYELKFPGEKACPQVKNFTRPVD